MQRLCAAGVPGDGVCAPQQDNPFRFEAGEYFVHHTDGQSHQDYRFWISAQVRSGQEVAGEASFFLMLNSNLI